jgi:hypothetical protein
VFVLTQAATEFHSYPGYRCLIVSNKFSAVMNDEWVKATSINPFEWLKAFVPALVCRK